MTTNINHRIATEVMGWTWGYDPDLEFWRWEDRDGRTSTIPSELQFMSRIDHAWLVVERLRQLGYQFDIDDYGHPSNKPLAQWHARFRNSELKREGFANADTAPEAICLAAIKVVEVSDG